MCSYRRGGGFSHLRKRRPRIRVLPMYVSIDVIGNPSAVNQDGMIRTMVLCSRSMIRRSIQSF